MFRRGAGSFGKYKLLAVVIGIALTAGPAYWFTSWLQKQGEAEVSITANAAIGLTELIIDQSIAALNDLAARDIDTCTPANIDLMRKSVFASGPIKEIALIGANGQTQCTDAGTTFEPRDILASAATSAPDVMLDVVHMADRDERLLRVRRLGARGKASLAALLPASAMLPQVAPDGERFNGASRMNLADGTLVGVSGTSTEDDAAQNPIVSRMRSGRFGPIVTVANGRTGNIATYDDLRRIGVVISGMVAVAILMCALLVPWRQRSSPISDIEAALIADEFIPYYQPIINLNTGRLLGAEVLVRWRKPDGTVIAPGAFIPLVESSGLVLDLTRSLMHRVCKEAGQALGRRPQMYISFNIAPRHFTDAIILNDVGAIFEGSPIRLTQVVLELTERYEIENLNATRRVVAALQGLGCRISLDDVGTGHSGLSYILKLGVDVIKIDKLFVEAIKTERQSQAIVKTLVDLASNLRMEIVAEGVEKQEQVNYLREHGISAGQGFIFAPPLPGAAFLKLVEAMDPDPGIVDELKSYTEEQATNVIAAFGRNAAA
jgi:sensor c-di-GMP phosphodiesterase-like protein